MMLNAEVIGALDVLPEPILLVATNGKIAAVNRALAAHLGVPRDALEGRHVSEILEDSPERAAEYIVSCGRSTVMVPGSLSLRPQNGVAVAYSAYGVAYRPTPTATSPALVLVRLIPKRDKDDRRKDEFLATLAHELRNPLAPIRNSMQIMQASEGDVATMSAARVIVERQLKHLARLIDDLLDISRITQGKIELRKEPVELGSVIQMALEIARPQLEGKQHPLQIELASQGLTLVADPGRLAQAFANLLSNASKYSATGSPIRIEATVEGEEHVVRVIDRGIGIPVDKLERIFELFEQVDRTGHGTHDGLGIGLTLVRRIAELHGGSAVAFSEGNERGSRFTVRLPRSIATNGAAPAKPLEQSVAPERRLRILVADDNRDAAQTLAMLLRLDGHDVRAVHDGAEALAIGDAFRPQLLLLDIGMPVLDGYEAARQVRERPWGKAAHLVALTGWGQESDRLKAMEAGFQYHLVKPTEPDALRAVIDRIVFE